MHLGSVEGVAQSGDAGKDLLHCLVEGVHCVVAALPQEHALHHQTDKPSAPLKKCEDHNTSSYSPCRGDCCCSRQCLECDTINLWSRVLAVISEVVGTFTICKGLCMKDYDKLLLC